MYYFTYPFKKMSISQSYNEGNHKPHWYNSNKNNDYPIDETVGTTGRSPAYAPVDMKVVKIYGLNTTTTTNAIVLETTSKVKTPLGDYKVYMTLTHPEEADIKKLKVGQVIKKGNIICYEGRDGNAIGNHIHLTCGIAPFKGLYENINGKWCYVGNTSNKPEQIFYVNTKFTEVINRRNIAFKTVTKDIVPTKNVSPSSFFPKKGYFCLGDTHNNIAKIAEFMYKVFPAYTKKEALGNYYGSNIHASIKEFQRRTGLEADGCVGPKTLKKLEEYGFKY